MAVSKRLAIALLILAAMCAFQLGWHVLLDVDSAVSVSLRKFYLRPTDVRSRRADVAFLCDVLLPAMIAGGLFKRYGKPVSGRSLWLFCPAVGSTLSALALCYPFVVDYELWWRVGGWPAVKDFLIGALVGSVFCWVTAFHIHRPHGASPPRGR
jgi:hypothetical protein